MGKSLIGSAIAAQGGTKVNPVAAQAAQASTDRLASAQKSVTPGLDENGHPVSGHSWINFLDNVQKNPWQPHAQYVEQPTAVARNSPYAMNAPQQTGAPQQQMTGQTPYNISPDVLAKYSAGEQAQPAQPWKVGGSNNTAKPATADYSASPWNDPKYIQQYNTNKNNGGK